ncbi:MAG: SDR family oxidoreductase [Acidobacteria bacterium]|nr:SDR family oxidoreductase [Acidobacteriota bacterium]
MDTGLNGKIALVCAASKGLGKAAALALAAEGARVAMCARHMPTLEAAAAEVAGATGGDVFAVAADLSRRADVERLVQQTVQHFGGLDILVTNSGGPKPGLFNALCEADWREAIDEVLMSVVHLCHAAVPHMKQRGGGRIINVTSISSKQPVPGLVLSNALRPAVAGLSKTLANELARDGILVNCVAPGYTRTDRVIELAEATARREGVTAEAVERRAVSNIPLGRMAEPAEFASVVVFLASERGSYITGSTMLVDGGYVRGTL